MVDKFSRICYYLTMKKEGGYVMLTKFGRFCRKLRIDKGELLLDMAKKLNVSAAFLSKVENGKSKPPIEWQQLIAHIYQLTSEEINELDEAMFDARNRDSIDLSIFNDSERDVMLAFARKLSTQNEDKEVDKIKRILRVNKGSD